MDPAAAAGAAMTLVAIALCVSVLGFLGVSLPPCGGGLGWGVSRNATAAAISAVRMANGTCGGSVIAWAGVVERPASGAATRATNTHAIASPVVLRFMGLQINAQPAGAFLLPSVTALLSGFYHGRRREHRHWAHWLWPVGTELPPCLLRPGRLPASRRLRRQPRSAARGSPAQPRRSDHERAVRAARGPRCERCHHCHPGDPPLRGGGRGAQGRQGRPRREADDHRRR